MFVLAELKDTVRVPPWQFQHKLNDAVYSELNKKLANKVVMNLGLCITLFDITKLEESFIFPGDGSSHTQVYFRFIVFRPFIDEILTGRIKSSSSEGVHVTLGFFEDIFIPADNLQQPSRFNADEQAWIWEYETEDGKHDLFMDTDEEIRFRIVDETFVDTSPSGPETESAAETTEIAEKKIPYSILGSISEPGLGLLSWWS